jgi:hypothetical protein
LAFGKTEPESEPEPEPGLQVIGDRSSVKPSPSPEFRSFLDRIYRIEQRISIYFPCTYRCSCTGAGITPKTLFCEVQP